MGKRTGYYTKEDFERLLMLRIQLFLRAVAFGATVLIFGYFFSRVMETPLASIRAENNYLVALAVLLTAGFAAAFADFPFRFIYRRFRRKKA